MNNLSQLTGKVALITGASRGIGRAIAIQLANAGAIVIGTATNSYNAENINSYLAENNFTGKGVVMDVADSVSVVDALTNIQKEFGSPDILINNAGIARDNLTLRMKQEEWDQIINTNLTSVFRLSKHCLKAMIKARWGRIISISSVVAHSGNAGQANYAAAKAGIIGLSKSLAQEIASRNVTVNVISPGFIETDMTCKLDEKQKSLILQQIPIGRMGQPDEIAATAVFLASPAAAYITGETIHVNGGMYMA